MTADGEITIDLGPLGAVLLDSPLPGPLGVNVEVGEIPAELTALPANPITGLANDLDAYVQLFSQPGAAVADASEALVTDAVGRAVVYWSALLVLIAAARFASRGLLRREAVAALRRPGVAALAIGLVVSGGVLTVASLGSEHRGGVTISALEGTELEGLRITGRMAGLIDIYGGQLLDAYRENEAFYEAVSANLRDGYAADPEPLQPVYRGGLLGPDTGQGEPSDPVTLLLVSDLHCNVGMAPVVAEAAELSGAQLVLDGGDTVMSGTSVESYCVNAFAGAVGDLEIIVSTGNHDSVVTAGQMASAGYTVLEGEPIERFGLRILGDTDPTLTAWGDGTSFERDESFEEMDARLTERACEADGVDILMVHNPVGIAEAMDSGCVTLGLSGHLHRRIGPEVDGQGVSYVSSSSAGAVSGGATVGPLNGTAELTVLRIDAANGQLLEYRILEIGTDASVVVGPWQEFPTPVPDWQPDPTRDQMVDGDLAVPAEEDTAGDAGEGPVREGPTPSPGG